MLGEERVLEAQERKERDTLVGSSEMGGWQAEPDEWTGLGWVEGEEQTHPSCIRGEANRGINREDRRKDAVVEDESKILSWAILGTQHRPEGKQIQETLTHQGFAWDFTGDLGSKILLV